MGMRVEQRTKGEYPALRVHGLSAIEFRNRPSMSVELPQRHAAVLMEKEIRLTQLDSFLDVSQGKVMMTEGGPGLVPAEISDPIIGVLPHNLVSDFQNFPRI